MFCNVTILEYGLRSRPRDDGFNFSYKERTIIGNKKVLLSLLIIFMTSNIRQLDENLMIHFC